MKILGFVCMFAGALTAASAVVAPEVDPASAGSAVALVAGALLIYRGRRQ